MPIYEYACAACGDRFDRLQGPSDAAPPCPACGEEQPRRLISMVAGLSGSSTGSSSATAGGSSGCACGGACACGR